jgi:hypothetical protein
MGEHKVRPYGMGAWLGANIVFARFPCPKEVT